jgi:hypothetical protein
MKYIKHKYINTREMVLQAQGSKRFFRFITLPELKIFKTLGFVISILL